MSFLGWFDGELRPDGWWDAELQTAAWFDTELIATTTGGGAYTLTAEAGSIPVSGDATLAFNRVVTADAGSVPIDGAATLAYSRVMAAESASVSVAGSAATLTYTPAAPIDVKVSWLAFDTSATPVDVKVSWLAFDTSATPCDVKVSWLCFDTSSTQGYSAEVNLRRWYVRRKKKILVFNTAQEADDYIESEQQAQEAIEKAQRTSRRARKRLRDRITVKPQVVVEEDQLFTLISRFQIDVNLPALLAQQDWERVMEIYYLAMQLQDDEDIELLLLA